MTILTERSNKLPPLSRRLAAIASMVHKGERVADIGCDHGYISIWLYNSGVSQKCIAADIKAGPVEAAKANIALYKAEKGVETRIGGGLTVLDLDEADTAVIAGMGGKTIIGILTESLDTAMGLNLVLSPQSEIAEVRRFLYEKGFAIEAERFIKEDEKYYPVIRAVFTGNVMTIVEEKAVYGPCLLAEKDALLKEYILFRKNWIETTIRRLALENSEKAAARRAELEIELQITDRALKYYE